jgi:hypothetical protein
MNQDQVQSIVRWCVTAACSSLVAHGWLTEDLVQPVIGMALAGAMLGWAIWSHSKPQALKAAARVDPSITVMVPDAIANKNKGIAKVVDDPKIHNVVPSDQ